VLAVLMHRVEVSLNTLECNTLALHNPSSGSSPRESLDGRRGNYHPQHAVSTTHATAEALYRRGGLMRTVLLLILLLDCFLCKSTPVAIFKRLCFALVAEHAV
jgi:hypothetical protein